MATAMEDAVSKALILMARTLANPPKVDRELIEIWSTILEGARLTPEEALRGAGIVASRAEFFPQPGRLIEAIRPPVDEDLEADRAWGVALDAIQRFGHYASLTKDDVSGDGRALWAIERMGWERLCTEMTLDKRAIWRSEFVHWFRLAKDQRANCEYVAGWLERDNFAKSHLAPGHVLTPAMCGRPDWKALPAAREGRPDAEPVKALSEGGFVTVSAAMERANGNGGGDA